MRLRVGGARWALGALVAGLTVVCALAGLVVASLIRVPADDAVDLPDRRAFEMRDADGARFAVRGVAQSGRDRLSEVPGVLADAVVAIEDRRFYDHWGIDLVGLARAAAVNLSAREVRQGGSTITQQLAKLSYLSPERTFTRKVQDAALAVWLDARLSKAQILRRYLQRAYFGNGVYGVSAAARRYFDKPLANLTVAEAAMLAGLIRAPSRLDPVAHAEAARARAELVLEAMVETGRLDPSAARAARENPAELAAPLGGGEVGSYFASWAEQRAHARLGTTYGDFTLRTTLEPELQRVLERATREQLAERGAPDLQAALVALRPDGAVAAMVGGRDFAESQYNRATQARRQPGSLFKAFVYLAALERGLRPESRVVDAPVEVDGWRPRNYRDGHRGPVTAETAFADSINTVAVKLAEQVGRERVIAAARRLGLGPDLPDVPSLALGAAETSLLEVTGAYAAIAAGDANLRPYALRAIASGEARLYTRPEQADARPLAPSPRVRQDLLALLRAAVERGTGQAAAVDGHTVRGKTGTSQGQRDAWFVGFVDGLTLGVWVGRDDAASADVVGGGLPARLWHAAVSRASEKGLIEPGSAAGARVARDRTAGDAAALAARTSGPDDRKPAAPGESAPSESAPGESAPGESAPGESASGASAQQQASAGSEPVSPPPSKPPRPAADEQASPRGAPAGDGRGRASRTAEPAAEPERSQPTQQPGTDTPEPASPPAVLTGSPQVLDTATLRIEGRIVKLHGVGRGTRRFADAMRSYIAGRPVTCRHARGRAYRCEVAGYNLAEVVVHNGGARADRHAPPAVARAEAQARRAGRGLWER